MYSDDGIYRMCLMSQKDIGGGKKSMKRPKVTFILAINHTHIFTPVVKKLILLFCVRISSTFCMTFSTEMKEKIRFLKKCNKRH